MNENEYLAGILNDQFKKDLPAVLVSLLNLKGSSPRHEGSKLLVTADGKSYGTIGGSILEASAIKKAQYALKIKKPDLFRFDMAATGTGAEGMMCGGNAEVLLGYLEPSSANKKLAEQWLAAVTGGKDCFLLTFFSGDEGDIKIGGRSLMFKDGTLLGDLPLDEAAAGKIKEALRTVTSATVLQAEDWNVLIDPMRKLKTLYLFGGGHVAVPTAHIAAMAGFRVVVVDDRPEYANAERFPEARETVVTPDFAHAVEDRPIDKDSYIVIITRGHQFDRVVLEQALKTNAEYIGMISSRRKRDVMYTSLRESGVPQSALDGVHSPIGLAIGGETPEEIAVSIVAEIISVRSSANP